jgi:hypothetical protein
VGVAVAVAVAGGRVGSGVVADVGLTTGKTGIMDIDVGICFVPGDSCGVFSIIGMTLVAVCVDIEVIRALLCFLGFCELA